jgi:hypothetical protein
MRSNRARRRRTRLAALPVALACVLASGAAAADSMRCGSKLIRDGDTRDAVAAKCGEPSDVQTRVVLRRPYYDFNGRIVYYGDGLVEVPVEIWTYNFGPYKLMRRIRLVDGIVEDIETLGYGYHDEAEG